MDGMELVSIKNSDGRAVTPAQVERVVARYRKLLSQRGSNLTEEEVEKLRRDLRAAVRSQLQESAGKPTVDEKQDP